MDNSTSNIETEYLELNTKNAWPALFTHIRNESSNNNYECTESLKPQNKSLNRYRDVSPYDHSRIVLQKGSCDYINANLVKVERANRQYILTQGPLPATVGNFWLMIWEQKSRAILMLNKIVENKQVKCHWYWPQAVGSEHKMVLEDVGLTLEYLEHHDHSYYSRRIFKLMDTESGNSQEIIQFHYNTWPDFGVPSSPTAFLEFLRVVRESGSLEPTVGPAVIHCSAGIGRSGTFCLVDSCLVLIENEGLNSVNVKEILLEMRNYRMGLIQTPDQLRFSYLAIIEGAKKLNSSCADTENCNSEHTEEYCASSEEDEPPPLPPPRGESLTRSTYMTECPPVNRPLPIIPNSTSLNDVTYEQNKEVKTDAPSRPLPIVPNNEEISSSDDELKTADSKTPLSSNSVSPTSEMRQRKRTERTERLAAQVRDIKRRQKDAEQWAELKRSLYKPVIVVGVGVLLLTGGFLAYSYFRS